MTDASQVTDPTTGNAAHSREALQNDSPRMFGLVDACSAAVSPRTHGCPRQVLFHPSLSTKVPGIVSLLRWLCDHRVARVAILGVFICVRDCMPLGLIETQTPLIIASTLSTSQVLH